jgi:hypothetical protein
VTEKGKNGKYTTKYDKRKKLKRKISENKKKEIK